MDLRTTLQGFLGFHPSNKPVDYHTLNETPCDGYTRHRITYEASDNELIPAYLLTPDGDGPFSAVLVHHQHHGERHFGKSEVCGLVGDPLQALGVALVQRGFIALAPDALCFEDRRHGVTGTEPHANDINQHFNAMCHRLVNGDTLMRKILDDAATGISLLQHHPQVIADKVGTLGHSFGGNTVLFHTALDERIRFACSSGALCSYQYKMAHNLGLEMALTIPGFAAQWDLDDILACCAPRPLLIVSADDDKHSQDADTIVDAVRPTYGNGLEHLRYAGKHALTQERVDAILDWMSTHHL